jgi:hypothetical protein
VKLVGCTDDPALINNGLEAVLMPLPVIVVSCWIQGLG